MLGEAEGAGGKVKKRIVCLIFVLLLLYGCSQKEAEEKSDLKSLPSLQTEEGLINNLTLLDEKIKKDSFSFCQIINDSNKKGCYYLVYLAEAIINKNFDCNKGFLPLGFDEIDKAYNICMYVKTSNKDYCEATEEFSSFCEVLFEEGSKEKDPHLQIIKTFLNALKEGDKEKCLDISPDSGAFKKEAHISYCVYLIEALN